MLITACMSKLKGIFVTWQIFVEMIAPWKPWSWGIILNVDTDFGSMIASQIISHTLRDCGCYNSYANEIDHHRFV